MIMKARFAYVVAAAGLAIAGIQVTFPTRADSRPSNELTAAAQAEINAVEAEIDRIEATALTQSRQAKLDRFQKTNLLGKLLFYDRQLSVNRNEACAFCHMPETGFSGPVSSLNQTTAAYPGSVRTRFGGRRPQAHTYASYARVLDYNREQGDFVGGQFWDMRATGLRLDSALAEQAQEPPLNPTEMGLIDPACMVYRVSLRPYRAMAQDSWGAQTFAIAWPANVNDVCDRPGPPPNDDPQTGSSREDRSRPLKGHLKSTPFPRNSNTSWLEKQHSLRKRRQVSNSSGARQRTATSVTGMAALGKNRYSPISRRLIWDYLETRASPFSARTAPTSSAMRPIEMARLM